MKSKGIVPIIAVLLLILITVIVAVIVKDGLIDVVNELIDGIKEAVETFLGGV